MKTKKKITPDQRILNCVPSKETNLDWKLVNAIDSNVLTAAPIPLNVDLRDPQWWKINNQEDTGSCVGWATADSVLRWHLVNNNIIQNDELLSVRFQWMAAKETDEFKDRATTFLESSGTSLKAALDIVRKYGAVKETVLPFNGILSKLDENTFYSLASKLKIKSYFNLAENGNKLNFRNWIANQGPILVRLDVDANFMNCGSDGILNIYDANSGLGGHAVALVGYTQDHFIIRNSWGKDWGDHGFAYASNNYTLQAFTEGYGIII
jgi:Papain family cysteine protease